MLLVTLGCGRSRRPELAVAPRDTVAARMVDAERATRLASGAIGIPPFAAGEANEVTTALAFAIADLLATDLARSAQVTVVERGRLADVLRELDLASSGVVDTATAPRAGRLLGAERLVLGAIERLPGGDFRVALRMADVATGVVAQALDARAPVAQVLEAEKALAFRVFDALGVNLTPAERARVGTGHTRSIEALVAYGRGAAAELRGDWQAAAQSFARARLADPGFLQATARATTAMTRATAVAATGTLLPGIRGVDAPVISVVDRLNRPIDHITSQTRPLGGVGDPAFPGTLVTVVVTVRRP